MDISKIMLIFTSMALVFAAFSAISIPDAQVISASTVPFSFSPSGNISSYFNESTTPNGNKIKSGYIANYGNMSQIISVNYSGSIFEAVSVPGQVWNFIEINGITAASDSSELSLDSKESEYYHINQWLKLGISGNCTGHKIYAYSKRVPSRIFGSSVSWDYDSKKSLIVMEMQTCTDNKVTLDFSAYPSYPGTFFIEDSSRYEDLQAKVLVLESELDSVAKKNMRIASEINTVENSSMILEDNISTELEKKNSLAIGIEVIRKNITDANETAKNLTARLNNNAILTPIQAFLVFAILAALIIYVFLFFRKDLSMKEKKVEQNEI